MKFKNINRLNLPKSVILLILFLCLGAIHPVTAQTTQNFSNINVDQLSDAQIKQFIQQVEAQGLSESQLEQVAQARGMSATEVAKLRARVNKIKQAGSSSTNTNTANSNTSSGSGERELNFKADTTTAEVSGPVSRIFGSELFKNSKISFEPNLRLATPQNYQLGPDDELNIDIYGYSEANYKLKVSPDGNINIPYVGMVSVGGQTIEQASQRIRSRLASIYPNMRGGNTKVNITLGNIRSIKVTLLGEVTRPGTYTLSSLSTVFNALYSSGGPAENGSFREIEIIRNNRVIAKLDVYEFLLRGFQRNNIRLQDQDIIRIPTYRKRVEFSGEVKRPAIFEATTNESLEDVIAFAGGFTSEAYTARIKVIQNTAKERRISDVLANNFNTYTPQNGDKYFAEPILDRFENRVSITGAVFRPGQYQLEPALTLGQLIRKAEGITEDAFLPRGYITRLRADNSPELISFDLTKIMNGSTADITLQREDQVTISSIFDLREEYKISIEGEVRSPGTIGYAENMSLEDLIILAGGFKEGASPKRIEISRRVKDSEAGAANSRIAQVYQLDVDKNLIIQGPKFNLQPFDIISVRNAAGYEIQRQVRVEGEVLYPGTYTITRKDERISDLIKRVGGLTDLAYLSGASLKRTEASEKGSGKNKINTAEEDQQKILKLQRLQETAKDSTDIIQQQDILRNDFVGIDLERILDKPKTKLDLILEEGDVLRVPKQLQTVKVSGEVLYPTTAIYNGGKTFRQYISDAGGFSDRSLKKRSYVIYANGAVRSTGKFLFFNNYPMVKPGAEIFVPKKAEQKKLSASEIVGLTSGIASLGAIILGVLNLIK
ncbi:SLBB domain-containing protein [Pedobacter sp. P351]|uniref:SLBB domain-containing protein n=1 Tax=Pedobacter superstes TaxID=3133441 RepID=UPI0030B54043